MRCKLCREVLDRENRLSRGVVDRREAVVERAADHGSYELVHVRLARLLLHDHVAVSKNGDVIADLEDLVHLVGDVHQGNSLRLEHAHHGEELVDLTHRQ